MTWYTQGPHAGETSALARVLGPGECADGSGNWLPLARPDGSFETICPSDPRYAALSAASFRAAEGLGQTQGGGGGRTLFILALLGVGGYFGWQLWKQQRPEHKEREQLSVQRGADDAAYEDAQDRNKARPRFWFDIWGPRYGWEPNEWLEFKRLYLRNLKSYRAEIAAEAT